MRMYIQAIPESNENRSYNACAYLRVINPLQCMEALGNVKVSISENWKDGRDCDVFYVQRFCRWARSMQEAEEFIEFCRKTEKKIIYEIDDNLLDSLDVSVREKSIIRFIARNASVVVVSTQPLMERMKRINPHVDVIPNMLSRKQIGDSPKRKIIGDKVKIGYMGTFTHQDDFQMILLPVLQVLHKYRDSIELEFVGAVQHPEILQSLSNVRIIPIQGRDEYPIFWKWILKQITWDVGLIPLKRTSFTVCKSDIKYLDYAAMGCCSIVSNHPAYSETITHLKTGVLCDNTVDSWIENLENLISNKDLRERCAMAAQEDLYAHRLLEDNIWRWEQLLI